MPNLVKVANTTKFCIFVSKYAIVTRRLNKENVDLKLKIGLKCHIFFNILKLREIFKIKNKIFHKYLSRLS